MKIYSTALQKGGVGKTTTALAIAYELSKKGKTVIVDADPQGNSTSSCISEIGNELADYLTGKKTVQEVLTKTSKENLYILPTLAIDTDEDNLNKLRNFRFFKSADNPDIFKFLRDDLEKESFDYCVFDTSPNFDIFEKNIFVTCDEVLGVINMDSFGFDGLTIFSENLKEFKKQRRLEKPIFDKVILNRYDKRLAMETQIMQQMESQERFSCFTVPTDQAFKKSQMKREFVQEEKSTKKETLEALETLASYLE